LGLGLRVTGYRLRVRVTGLLGYWVTELRGYGLRG
jgi:hypothetical protein